MNENTGGASAAMREIAGQLIELAENAEKRDQTPSSTRRHSVALFRESRMPKLANLAKEIYDRRAARVKYFGSDFSSEPAWDILLDLFFHRGAGVRVCVTSAAIASNAAPTTALRYIAHLESIGLIERVPSETDRRTYWLELTPLGQEKMTGYLSDLSKRQSEPQRLSANDEPHIAREATS
ncbi:helix-turn-helix domain-containing protein [Parerythrobacter jejuensis]|uniref:HTH marR-type domain-containing protein n=1 Tax=Parerythrobacter jejuensis TaxID=795812 RepID=A0A845AU14_9SPHN|nr:hypothetical protein [Parerythrobacter jejuensis]MXP30334.1 hypothetical protein [Parerythrobacter jejuensis]MXP33094.1 hypothetical protein [Parerythrobacter jejuensis]